MTVDSVQHFKKGTPVKNEQGQTSVLQKNLTRILLKGESGNVNLVLDYEEAKTFKEFTEVNLSISPK